MTPSERTYAKLQDRKDQAANRFATATTSIKNWVNSSLKKAQDFFAVARKDGARDVLLSASAVSSANENHLLSSLSPEEAVRVYTILGALKGGLDPISSVPDASQKELLLAKSIIIGYQLSDLPESPHSTDSAFDLQIQPDGCVEVVAFPQEEVEPDPEE